ncbi:elongation factor 1-gamma-like [Chiloscyllium punctatum]|uniref:elongation factor 1-gamma-like n=1 Tax=Chiloscyllium punctatum TaxID=137246 RepID=UPI003B63AB19
MAAMTLYTPPDFWRSYAVLIAAEYSNVPLTVVSKDSGFCSKTSCTSLNVHGKVPVLVADSGFCVQESNAVAYYVSSSMLRGTSIQEAALIQQWINFAESELIPPTATWLFPTSGTRKFNKQVVEHAKADIKKVLLLLNDHLHNRTYLVGEHITLADITLVCAMLGLYKQVLDPSLRENYTDVNRWFFACVNEPPFRKVLGEVVFCEPAAQCSAPKPLETQDVAKIETSSIAIPTNKTNEVGPVDTGLDKEITAVGVPPAAPLAEVGTVGAEAPPLKQRPTHAESLLDVSEEQISVVCASMKGRIKEETSISCKGNIAPENESEAMVTKEKNSSVVLIDFSEEITHITSNSKEQEVTEEVTARVQEGGTYEATKLVVPFNQLESTVDCSAQKATVGVTLPELSSSREDVQESFVHKSKEESVTEIRSTGAPEEQKPVGVSQLDAPKCEGAEETTVKMVAAPGKAILFDSKIRDCSEPDASSKLEARLMDVAKDSLAREESVSEACVTGSLEEVTVAALSIPDPFERDAAGKVAVTGTTSAFMEDILTTDTVLQETSKEKFNTVDPSLVCGPVVTRLADVSKENGTADCGKMDTSPRGKLATEGPKGLSQVRGDDQDCTKSTDLLKIQDPFAHLPKSVFVLDEFKWKYSNEDIRSVALPYLWDHFDKDGWSVWYMEYKYPSELCLDCSSLITGLFQHLDSLREYSFASVILFGTGGDSSISGIWIMRGQQLLPELNEDWRVTCELYSWKKLDIDTDECKTMINEYFMLEGAFQHMGKPFNQAIIFK